MSICDDLPKETIDLMCEVIGRMHESGHEYAFTATAPDFKPSTVAEGTETSVAMLRYTDVGFHTHPRGGGSAGRYAYDYVMPSIPDFVDWALRGRKQQAECIGVEWPPEGTVTGSHIRCYEKGPQWERVANEVGVLTAEVAEATERFDRVKGEEKEEMYKEWREINDKRGNLFKRIERALAKASQRSRIVRLCQIDCKEGRDG